MSNVLLHRTARENYEHLRLTYRRLLENLNKHDLATFCIVAHHLHEAVEHDPTSTQTQKDRAKQHKAEGRGLDALLAQCIANNTKHPQRAKGNRPGGEQPLLKGIYTELHLVQPWTSEEPTVGLPDGSGWAGGLEYILEDRDGTKHHAFSLVHRTFRFWEEVFEGPRQIGGPRQMPFVEFIREELERLERAPAQQITNLD